jgi:CBS domain-containing protein
MNTTNSYQPKVKDLMTEEVFTLFPDDDLQFLEEALDWQRIRHVPVIDHNQKLVGVLTQRDFLRLAISDLANISKEERRALYKSIKVEDVMTKEPFTAKPEMSLEQASQMMGEFKIGCLPVTEDAKLVGILTESDFVKSFNNWNVSFVE